MMLAAEPLPAAAAGRVESPEVTVTFELLPQSDDGSPLSGTLVVRPSGGDGDERTLPVNAKSLSLSAQPGSRLRVDLISPDWWLDPHDVTVAPSGGAVRLRVWPRATITGQFTGVPLEKMPGSLKLVVEAPPWREGQDAIARGTELRCQAGDSGRWSCAGPATKLDLVAIASGYVPQYRWGVQLTPGGTTDLGTVALREGGAVAAWLSPASLEASRKSAPRAVLRRQVPPEPSATTQRLAQPVAEAAIGANGFVQLAPVAEGAYVLEFRANGFATTKIFPLEVKAGRETVVRRPVELAPPIRIAIRVDPPTDPDGTPWKATVRRASSFGSAYDREAVFSESVPLSGEIVIPGQSPGKFRISIADAAGNRLADEELIAESERDPPSQIRIDVVPVHGRIRKGAEGVAGDLIFGGVQGVPSVRMTSGETGAFSGWLPREGPWVVDVRSADRSVSTALQVEVRSGRELDLVLARTRVAGIVLNGAGPVDAARVVLSDGKGLLLRAVTDAEGRFEFAGAPPGKYTVIATARTGETSSAQHVELAKETAVAEGLRLELLPPGVVTGLVMGNGRPLALAHVHVFAGNVGTGGVTDVDGRFRISVPPQERRGLFVIRAPGRVLTVYERDLEPENGFDLASTGGSLQFHLPARLDGLLLLQNGVRIPLPLALAWAQSQGLPVRQNALVTIPNVAIGDYRLCAAAGAANPRCTEGRLHPGGTLNLEIPE